MTDLLAPITRRLIAPAWAAWERSPYLRHYRLLRRPGSAVSKENDL